MQSRREYNRKQGNNKIVGREGENASGLGDRKTDGGPRGRERERAKRKANNKSNNNTSGWIENTLFFLVVFVQCSASRRLYVSYVWFTSFSLLLSSRPPSHLFPSVLPVFCFTTRIFFSLLSFSSSTASRLLLFSHFSSTHSSVSHSRLSLRSSPGVRLVYTSFCMNRTLRYVAADKLAIALRSMFSWKPANNVYFK